MPQDQIKKFNLKVIKDWWEEVKDWPEAKKRVLVYIFLAVLAIPFLVLAGMNFKYQASKLGLQPILKTDLNSTGTAELRNSLNEVLEANKKLDKKVIF
ncbi:MAG: hypothetical protein NTV62_04455 [Candidatus Gribaldobacteria bacterium]|nr:hypothetical protein [Candidatus Gribaldobacteria bacterium]